MKIYSFVNDYSEGCHPLVLESLIASNHSQQSGYGEDIFCKNASVQIRQIIDKPDADIHFIAGGTLANLIVLASILKPFESIIAADTGHINTHEAGAIEAVGHKIESVFSKDGKLAPENLSPLLDKFPEFHTVKPRVVYISNSTEIGTIYRKEELRLLYEFCKENDLILFVDGARLPVALTAEKNDMTIKDIANHSDVFYIGGTKCGALFGEAVVIVNDSLKKDFKYYLKQRGGMMAKGRAMGAQFERLLQDNLIFDLAEHANTTAAKIAATLQSLGYQFLSSPETNQLFPMLPNSVIAELQKEYDFMIWKKTDESNSVVRIVTSWATPPEIVDRFTSTLRNLSS